MSDNIGAACDEALAEIIMDSIGLEESAQEVIKAWPPLPNVAHPMDSTHQRELPDEPQAAAAEPAAQPQKKGGLQTKGSKKETDAQQPAEEGHADKESKLKAQASTERGRTTHRDPAKSSRSPSKRTSRSPGRSTSPRRSRSPSARKSQGTLKPQRSKGAAGYSQLHNLRTTRKSQELLAIVSNTNLPAQASITSTLSRTGTLQRAAQELQLSTLLPVLQPVDGMDTPPAIFLNERLMWELEEREAALEAELNEAAEEADLQLAREERAMDRVLRDAGVHPDDINNSSEEQQEGQQQGGTTKQISPFQTASGDLEERPESSSLALPPTAVGQEEVAYNDLQKAESASGALQATSSADLQALPRVNSEEIMARAEALNSPLAQARKVMPLSSGGSQENGEGYTQLSVFASLSVQQREAAAAQLKAQQEQQQGLRQGQGQERNSSAGVTQTGAVPMQLYMQSPDVLTRKQAQEQKASRYEGADQADQPMTPPAAPTPTAEDTDQGSGGPQDEYSVSYGDSEEQEEFIHSTAGREAEAFQAAQRARSKAIAEQLARLQQESRLLQEQSKALQERAVAIQREAGVGPLLSYREAQPPLLQPAASVPPAPPPPGAHHQAVHNASKGPAAPVQATLKPARKPSADNQQPLQPVPSLQMGKPLGKPSPSVGFEEHSSSTTGAGAKQPAPISWGVPQRKPSLTSSPSKVPQLPTLSPQPTNTPPPPIPSKSPEPAASNYTHVMHSYYAASQEGQSTPLRRQGSSTSTIEPMLPRWSDQLASSENSPMGSPQHYRRFNSPLKTHPSPDRKNRIQQQVASAQQQQQQQQPHQPSQQQHQQQQQQQQQQQSHQAGPSAAQQVHKSANHRPAVDAASQYYPPTGPATELPPQHATNGQELGVVPAHKPRRFLPEVRMPLLLAVQPAREPKLPPAPPTYMPPKAGFMPPSGYMPPKADGGQDYQGPMHMAGMWSQQQQAAMYMGMPGGMQQYGMWPGAPAMPNPQLAAEYSSESMPAPAHAVGSKPLPHKPAQRKAKSGRTRNGAHPSTNAAHKNDAQHASSDSHLPHIQQPLAAIGHQAFAHPGAVPSYGYYPMPNQPYAPMMMGGMGMMPSAQHPMQIQMASPRQQQQQQPYPGFYGNQQQGYQQSGMGMYPQQPMAPPTQIANPQYPWGQYPQYGPGVAIAGTAYGVMSQQQQHGDAEGVYKAQMLHRVDVIHQGQLQHYNQVEGDVMARLDRKHVGAGSNKQQQQQQGDAGRPPFRVF